MDQDFTDDEIDDQLGDEDFVNDFAEQLHESLDNLQKECDVVMADCAARKKRLTDALIWGDEEEIAQLAEAEMKLMKEFYNDVGGPCNDWYGDASEAFGQDVENFKPAVAALGKHKYMLLNYAAENFHTLKNQMFGIVDKLIDSQRTIESTVDYFETKALATMSKRLSTPAWKYQLKYSTRLTKRCGFDAHKVTEDSEYLLSSTAAVAKEMSAAKGTFSEAASADWVAWNCKEMYPQPKKVDLGVPGWLGGVTDAAKKGFAVYNVAKDLIPGGSTAGAGDVPGSGSEMELGFMDTAAGMGKKLKDELDENDDDKEKAWQKRLSIWRQALAMCNADRAAFAEEIEAVKTTMRKMETPVPLAAVKPFGLADDIANYGDAVAAADMGDMDAAETAAATAMLETLETAVQANMEAAVKRGDEARALKDTLIG